MKKQLFVTRKIYTFLLILILVLFIPSTAQADAGKKALKYLKGKWYTASIDLTGHPQYMVKFTKKYVKYYSFDEGKDKYVFNWKAKLVSAKKTKNGYLIKVKNGNHKYCYEGDKKILCYYMTWNRKKFGDNYSGSSSLGKSW